LRDAFFKGSEPAGWDRSAVVAASGRRLRNTGGVSDPTDRELCECWFVRRGLPQTVMWKREHSQHQRLLKAAK